MLLLKSWRLQTILDCKILSLLDTLWILLAGFVTTVWNMVLESMHLGLTDLIWSLRCLQPKQNFFDLLVTILWSTVPSTFAQQIFLVVSGALCLNLNLQSISSWIILHCVFICMTFKLHIEWSNATHQQPWYHQLQQVPSMTSNALVTWYMPSKLGHTKTFDSP